MKRIVGWSSKLTIAAHKHKELNELEKEKKIFFKNSLLRIERIFCINRQLASRMFFFPHWVKMNYLLSDKAAMRWNVQ